MSNEQQVAAAVAESTQVSGSRCDECSHCNNPNHVGQPSPGTTLKQRWHAEGNGKSLKQFARSLLASKDEAAKDWFDYKSGALNEVRSDKNKARVGLERQASKAARKKASKGATKNTTEAPAAK